jgi:hypothetical protein
MKQAKVLQEAEVVAVGMTEKDPEELNSPLLFDPFQPPRRCPSS